MGVTYVIPGRKLHVVAHFQSDVGCVREINQDVAGIFEGEDAVRGCLLLVADGMGGAAAGEVASRLAMDTVSQAYFDPASADDSPAEALGSALVAGNQAIYARGTQNLAMSGMGTTCSTVAITGPDYHVAHVGDSRVYAIENGSIEQITQDHSLAAEMRRRAGGEEIAMGVPTNVLTRCLGVSNEVDVDLFSRRGAVRPGLSLLLCSDGLTNMVDDATICRLVSENTPEEACAQLVERARANGGPDNITVLIARVEAA